MDEGGYFFFVISITSAIMETIRVRSRNNSLYVIISTALLSWEGESALSKIRGPTAYRIGMPYFEGILTYFDLICNRNCSVFKENSFYMHKTNLI